MKEGKANILVKAQINPLKGDSSMRTNVGSWYKKKSLAYDHIPHIAAEALDDGSGKVRLILVNPTEIAMQIEIGGEWEIRIGAFDELEELDQRWGKLQMLEKDDNMAEYVVGTRANMGVLEVPIRIGEKIEVRVTLAEEDKQDQYNFSFAAIQNEI